MSIAKRMIEEELGMNRVHTEFGEVDGEEAWVWNGSMPMFEEIMAGYGDGYTFSVSARDNSLTMYEDGSHRVEMRYETGEVIPLP